jgi:hypothetical protein
MGNTEFKYSAYINWRFGWYGHRDRNGRGGRNTSGGCRYGDWGFLFVISTIRARMKLVLGTRKETNEDGTQKKEYKRGNQ